MQELVGSTAEPATHVSCALPTGFTASWLVDEPISPHPRLLSGPFSPAQGLDSGILAAGGFLDLLPLVFCPLLCREEFWWVFWLWSQSRWDVWLSWTFLNLLLLDQLPMSDPTLPTSIPGPSFLSWTVGTWGEIRGLGDEDARGCLTLLRGAPLWAGLVMNKRLEHVSPCWTL